MSKQKQKWSIEEEKALSDGVKSHGLGKWTHKSILVNRSNVDLKDKWRNMTVSGDVLCATNRASVGPSFNSPQPSTTAVRSRSSKARKETIDYKALILEAISSIKDPNGPDLNAILVFIEDKYILPGDFKNSVTKMLTRLVTTGEIKEVNKRFKVECSSSEREVISITALPCDSGAHSDDLTITVPPRDAKKEAAIVAARAIAVAERLSYRLLKANEKVEKLDKMLEESVVMMELAKEIHSRCLKTGMVVLND